MLSRRCRPPTMNSAERDYDQWTMGWGLVCWTATRLDTNPLLWISGGVWFNHGPRCRRCKNRSGEISGCHCLNSKKRRNLIYGEMRRRFEIEDVSSDCVEEVNINLFWCFFFCLFCFEEHHYLFLEEYSSPISLLSYRFLSKAETYWITSSTSHQ